MVAIQQNKMHLKDDIIKRALQQTDEHLKEVLKNAKLMDDKEEVYIISKAIELKKQGYIPLC